eukprot:TRINITY_DN3057_c0_g1_i1.p1 TRINITY_DN3057_c0_g1~~TRINITY_DN3057_c0_g1_i1.p1  ORF type:complete len:1619 (+),score=604.27 TRINITY_DN3057_c0_g1_i1:45-4859(+)
MPLPARAAHPQLSELAEKEDERRRRLLSELHRLQREHAETPKGALGPQVRAALTAAETSAATTATTSSSTGTSSSSSSSSTDVDASDVSSSSGSSSSSATSSSGSDALRRRMFVADSLTAQQALLECRLRDLGEALDSARVELASRQSVAAASPSPARPASAPYFPAPAPVSTPARAPSPQPGALAAYQRRRTGADRTPSGRAASVSTARSQSPAPPRGIPLTPGPDTWAALTQGEKRLTPVWEEPEQDGQRRADSPPKPAPAPAPASEPAPAPAPAFEEDRREVQMLRKVLIAGVAAAERDRQRLQKATEDAMRGGRDAALADMSAQCAELRRVCDDLRERSAAPERVVPPRADAEAQTESALEIRPQVRPEVRAEARAEQDRERERLSEELHRRQREIERLSRRLSEEEAAHHAERARLHGEWAAERQALRHDRSSAAEMAERNRAALEKERSDHAARVAEAAAQQAGGSAAVESALEELRRVRDDVGSSRQEAQREAEAARADAKTARDSEQASRAEAAELRAEVAAEREGRRQAEGAEQVQRRSREAVEAALAEVEKSLSDARAGERQHELAEAELRAEVAEARRALETQLHEAEKAAARAEEARALAAAAAAESVADQESARVRAEDAIRREEERKREEAVDAARKAEREQHGAAAAEAKSAADEVCRGIREDAEKARAEADRRAAAERESLCRALHDQRAAELAALRSELEAGSGAALAKAREDSEQRLREALREARAEAEAELARGREDAAAAALAAREAALAEAAAEQAAREESEVGRSVAEPSNTCNAPKWQSGESGRPGHSCGPAVTLEMRQVPPTLYNEPAFLKDVNPDFHPAVSRVLGTRVLKVARSEADATSAAVTITVRDAREAARVLSATKPGTAWGVVVGARAEPDPLVARTESLFADVCESYDGKAGDVVDELLSNLRFRPGDVTESQRLRRLGLIAREAAHVAGSSDLAGCLSCRLFTQRPLDVDRDLGWVGVPPSERLGDSADTKARRERYESRHSDWNWAWRRGLDSRNGSLCGAVCAALRDGARGSSSQSVMRHWAKWIGAVMAASGRTADPDVVETVWYGLTCLPEEVVSSHRRMQPGDWLSLPALCSASRNQQQVHAYAQGTPANSVREPSARAPGTVLFRVSQPKSAVLLEPVSQYPSEGEVVCPPLVLHEVTGVCDDRNSPLGHGLHVAITACQPLASHHAFVSRVADDLLAASQRLGAAATAAPRRLADAADEVEALRQHAASAEQARRAAECTLLARPIDGEGSMSGLSLLHLCAAPEDPVEPSVPEEELRAARDAARAEEAAARDKVAWSEGHVRAGLMDVWSMLWPAVVSLQAALDAVPPPQPAPPPPASAPASVQTEAAPAPALPPPPPDAQPPAGPGWREIDEQQERLAQLARKGADEASAAAVLAQHQATAAALALGRDLAASPRQTSPPWQPGRRLQTPRRSRVPEAVLAVSSAVPAPPAPAATCPAPPVESPAPPAPPAAASPGTPTPIAGAVQVVSPVGAQPRLQALQQKLETVQRSLAQQRTAGAVVLHRWEQERASAKENGASADELARYDQLIGTTQRENALCEARAEKLLLRLTAQVIDAREAAR